MCVFICVHVFPQVTFFVCACACIQVQRSEDNSWELVLSCHLVESKNLSHQMFMLTLPCEPSCQAWWHNFLGWTWIYLRNFKYEILWKISPSFIKRVCNLNMHCKIFRSRCQCLKGLPHYQFATVSLGCKPTIKQLVNLSANTWKFVMVW